MTMKFYHKPTKTKSILAYCAYSAGVGIILLFFARNFDWFGEFYASRIYPIFPNSLGRLMSLFPFSVFEILIYLFVLTIVIYIIYFLFSVVFPKLDETRLEIAKRLGIRFVCVFLAVICTMFLLFTCTTGINYSRDTFAELTNRQIAPSSREELRALAEHLINDLTELSRKIPVDEHRRFTLGDLDVNSEAREAMRLLGEEIPVLAGFYPNSKPVIASRVMSHFNITGIFTPTVEANFNQEVPDHLIPFTIVHELAHFRGFMREDEANFIAYLACRGSESVEFRYSGAINALRHVLNAYAQVATPHQFNELMQTVPRQVQRDFAANREFWDQFRGRAAEISTRVNDAYLRANAQEDGVRSYGRMVDLLLAEYRNSF